MEGREILKGQLGTVDRSLFFLMLIVLSVLLSFWSVLIQRGRLEQALSGCPQGAAGPDVFPIKFNASALTTISLGYFFDLALRSCREAAQGKDPAAQRSAGMNVWASLFVLTAALIRFYDLNFMQACQRSLVEEDTQPE